MQHICVTYREPVLKNGDYVSQLSADEVLADGAPVTFGPFVVTAQPNGWVTISFSGRDQQLYTCEVIHYVYDRVSYPVRQDYRLSCYLGGPEATLGLVMKETGVCSTSLWVMRDEEVVTDNRPDSVLALV